MNKNKNNQSGFTMIELIIVVTIMGIIGAVLVPTFSNMSTKARLTSDITAVKTLQKQFEIYKAETGAYPEGFPTGGTAEPVPGTTIIKLVPDYIDGKDLTSTNTLRLQSDGILKAKDGRCYLSYEDASKYKSYIAGLKDSDGNKGYAVVDR